MDEGGNVNVLSNKMDHWLGCWVGSRGGKDTVMDTKDDLVLDAFVKGARGGGAKKGFEKVFGG